MSDYGVSGSRSSLFSRSYWVNVAHMSPVLTWHYISRLSDRDTPINNLYCFIKPANVLTLTGKENIPFCWRNFRSKFCGAELILGGINQYNSLVLSHRRHAHRSIVHAVMSTATATRSSAVWQAGLVGHFIINSDRITFETNHRWRFQSSQGFWQNWRR